jgi:two-component system response regulator MtrA
MLVEDDEALRNQLDRWLTESGYEVIPVGDGSGAVEIFKAENPNVVLMDIQLPGRNGIELVRDIREFAGTPIIMVTARSEAEVMDEAFQAGADDYFEKSPWEPEKLLARIKNSLRVQQRGTPETTNEEEANGVLKIGSVTVDILGHEVRKNGEKISLTPYEFKLLTTLAEKPKLVFSREQLLKDVWNHSYQGDTRLVNVHIQRLRSKIEDDPDNPTVVVTVRGIGYKAGLN